MNDHPPVVTLRPAEDWPETGRVMVDLARVRAIIERIAADVDELARARRVEELDTAAVRLTLTANAEPIAGGIDADTAGRLHAALTGISPQTRRHLIDILIDTVRRSGRAAQDTTPAPAPTTTRPWPPARHRAGRTPPTTVSIGTAGT